MNPVAMADALGVEVYAVDGLAVRAECSIVEGVPVIWVRLGLQRQERDHVVWKLLRRLRKKALAASAADLPQSLSLH